MTKSAGISGSIAALVAVATFGCRERPSVMHTREDVSSSFGADAGAPGAASISDPATEAGEAADPRLPPLEATSWLVPLPVEGFADALVAVPLGSRERRPLIVALHGNFDRPEWACGSWREVAGPDPFILCLRGKERSDSPPGDARFTYAGSLSATKELNAARIALHKRFGDRLLETNSVYAGFSLGAIVGVSIAVQTPALYPRLALVEGGYESWNASTARQYQKGGGERVLFVCSQRGCLSKAREAAKLLRKAGVLAEVVDGGDHGHRYDGPIADATRSRWTWLNEELSHFGTE